MPLTAVTDPAAPLFVLEGEALARFGLEQEWLLANRAGGFAMGTVLGVPTRRYHALAMASMSPPVERVAILNALDERVIVDVDAEGAQETRLTLFHFEGGEAPRSHPHLVRFERGFFGCRWRYEIPLEGRHRGQRVVVEKSLHLFENRSAASVKYAVRSPGVAVRIEVRPLVRLTDMHHLRTAQVEPHFAVRSLANGCVLTDGHLGVTLLSGEGSFRQDLQWWRGLSYAWERDRGQDWVEDLTSPGVFSWTTVPAPGGTGVMTLTASTDAIPAGLAQEDAAARDRRVAEAIRRTIVRAGGDRLNAEDLNALAALARAADQFVVRRVMPGEEPGTSVIAGYPWFSDWGRDTMIALPGLLIETGRLDEARSVLETFARHERNGIIPNRFSDHTGDAEYNTVDASLWFLHAAAALAREEAATSSEIEEPVLRGRVGAACRSIIEWYQRGTDFGIGMDGDGLIFAGDEDTPLTWMDAKRDGIAFTPRPGKAVEINALWIHGLRALAAVGMEGASKLELIAETAAGSFNEKFVDDQTGGLIDRLDPAGNTVRDIRPNQVFAASLEHSPLSVERRRGVIGVVREHLLTPMGLRTLSPRDARYRGRFEGPLTQRDAAYHNGTVWPWLIGAYVEGLLRSEGFSQGARDEARRALVPLVGFVLGGPLVGQLPEVFDGDEEPGRPRRWRGCVAQAWSVAEVLRALSLTIREE